jgi:transposase
MENAFQVYVGIDLAVVAAHQAWVLDDRLQKIGEKSFDPSAGSIAGFVDWLHELAAGRPIAVGLEAPHGAVVEALLERDVAVFHINPKQVDRFRDRESVSGAKDDRRDARVLARALCTDFDCFREVLAAAPEIVRLRELSRERDDLVSDLGAAANRLRDQLVRYYPQALRLSPAANDPWFWEVLELAPTPPEAVHLELERVKAVLKRRRIKKLKAKEVVHALKEQPVKVAAGLVDACRGHVRRLTAILQTTHSALREVETHLAAELEKLRQPVEGDEGKAEHRDAAILLSMPGVGEIVGATVLSEAADALRDRDYTRLRTLAGVAPVTKASGLRRHSGGRKQGGRRGLRNAQVVMRRACSPRLRNALHHWAAVAAQWDTAAKAHYQALTAAGQSRGRALRGVADRLLRILFAALKSGQLYSAAHPAKSPYAAAAPAA